jgi:branched-chain amino acid aminotransferase
MSQPTNGLPDWDRLGFAFVETDHYYRAVAEVGRDPEWDGGQMLPFGPVTLSPAAALFSYGLGIFEGLKARRTADGSVKLFRHRDNAKRFRRSAERLLLMPFPENDFVAGVEQLVRRNLRFVPPAGKGTFYVRPLQHAIEPIVGIRPGSQFWVLMFGCPVGSYFSGKSDAGAAGLRLRVLEQGRVAAGGTGAAKAMGNYAGGMALARPWQGRGFDDVLYLDARHVKYVTETSGSNVFVKLKSGPLVTPPLDDQILAGLTRDSVIRLAREVIDLEVLERAVSLEEVLDDAEEIFCTGTAWTVVNVRELDHNDRVYRFDASDVQKTLLDELRGIQDGEREDRFGWTTEVSPPDDRR